MFHLSLLQRTALQLEEAAATALAALAESPDHLLNLSAAAEALVQAGDSVGAREHYGHFLEVYDTEMALQRQEYLDHQIIIPNMRLSAQDLMGGQG
jgi:hypothetical protein